MASHKLRHRLFCPSLSSATFLFPNFISISVLVLEFTRQEET